MLLSNSSQTRISSHILKHSHFNSHLNSFFICLIDRLLLLQYDPMAVSSLQDLLQAHRHKEKELFNYLLSVYNDTSKRQPSYPVLTEDHCSRPSGTRPSIRYTRDLGSKELKALALGDSTTDLRQEGRAKGRGVDRGGSSRQLGAEERERSIENDMRIRKEKEKERARCRSSVRSSGHMEGSLADNNSVHQSLQGTYGSPGRTKASLPQPKLARRKSFKSRIARKHETIKLIRKILAEHSPDNFKYADRMLRDYIGREEDLLEKLLQDFGLTDERDTEMERERERDLLTSYDKSYRVQYTDSSESTDDTPHQPQHKPVNELDNSAVDSTSSSTQHRNAADQPERKFKKVPSSFSTGSVPSLKGSTANDVRNGNAGKGKGSEKARTTSLNLPVVKKEFLVTRQARALSLSSSTVTPSRPPIHALAPVVRASRKPFNHIKTQPVHREPERESWPNGVPIELPSPLGRYPHNSAPSEVPPHPSPMGPGSTFGFNRTFSTSPSRAPRDPIHTTTEKKNLIESKRRMSDDVWTAEDKQQNMHPIEHRGHYEDSDRLIGSPKWSIGALDAKPSPAVQLTLDVTSVSSVKGRTSALSRLFQEASPITSPAASPLLTGARNSRPFLDTVDDMVDIAGKPLGGSWESYSFNTITLHLPPRKASLTHTHSAPQMISPPSSLPTPLSPLSSDRSHKLLPFEVRSGQSQSPPPPSRISLPPPLHITLPPPPPIRSLAIGISKVTPYSACYGMRCDDRGKGSDGNRQHRSGGEGEGVGAGAGGKLHLEISDCSSTVTTTTPLSPCSPTQ